LTGRYSLLLLLFIYLFKFRRFVATSSKVYFKVLMSGEIVTYQKDGNSIIIYRNSQKNILLLVMKSIIDVIIQKTKNIIFKSVNAFRDDEQYLLKNIHPILYYNIITYQFHF